MQRGVLRDQGRGSVTSLEITPTWAGTVRHSRTDHRRNRIANASKGDGNSFGEMTWGLDCNSGMYSILLAHAAYAMTNTLFSTLRCFFQTFLQVFASAFDQVVRLLK